MGQAVEASIFGRYPVKQQVIDTTGIITEDLVAAVSSKSIRVISLLFTVNGPTNIRFLSAAANISGLIEFADSGGMTIAVKTGVFWTQVGDALRLNVDAAVLMSGVLTYIEVDGD